MLYGIPFEYKGVCDVQQNFDTYFKLLLNKVMSLFKFKNLPPTIDEKFLKTQLILNGKVCITQFNGTDLYALNGNVGGEPNVYYEPQFFIIANPILGSKQVRIRQKDGSDKIDGLEGILVGLTSVDQESDCSMGGGLFGLIYQTAGLLADNISSLNVAQINGRATVAYSADSLAMANSAEEVLKDIYAGKPYRVLSQNILENITTTPLGSSGNNNTLMTLIETHQYILAQFYNEIGIAGNWNMKRERINTAETELMSGSLDISVFDMIKSLKDGFEKVNELFGTSIEVELNEEVRTEAPETSEEVDSIGIETGQDNYLPEEKEEPKTEGETEVVEEVEVKSKESEEE